MILPSRNDQSPGKPIFGWKYIAYYVVGIAITLALFFAVTYMFELRASARQDEIFNDQNEPASLSVPNIQIDAVPGDLRLQQVFWGGLLVIILLGISLLFYRFWQQVQAKPSDHLKAEVERRTAALAASEARYRMLVENSPLGIVLCNKNGEIATVNPALLEIMGSPSVEATMQLNLLTFPLLVEAGISASIRRCMEQDELVSVSHQYTSKWGKRTHLNLHITPIHNDNGLVAGVQAIVEDITPLKQADAALAEERNLLRTLVDSLPDSLIFVKDTQSRFVTTNAAHLRVLGVDSVNEVVGKTDFDFFPHELAEQYFADEQMVMQSAQPLIDHEEPVIDYDGSSKWLLTTKAPLKDLNGKIIGLVGISQNITTRKQTEAALKEREQEFEILLKSITDYVWSADVENGRVKYRYYSPVVADITGYPPEHFMTGLNAWLDIIHGEDRPQAEKNVVEELSGQVVTHEYRIIRPDGKIRWLYGNTSPTLNSEGRVIRLQGVVSDITERKHVEQLLTGQTQILESIARGISMQQVLETLTQLVEKLSDGALCSIMLLDENGKCLRHGAAPSLPDGYNQAIDGIAVGPHVGSCGSAAYLKQPVFVADIATDSRWKNYKDLALKYELRACWSTPIFSINGQVLGVFAMYYHEAKHPVDHDLELVNLSTHLASIAIERDQTEAIRQRLEEQLRQSQKMEAIGALAGGIAHDFNNLLTAIMGYAELATKTLPPDADALYDIQGIQKTAERAASLTRQLLAFARRQLIVPNVINLNTLILDLGKMLRRLIGENVELDLRPAEDLWPIKVDPGQFEQVLVNLAVNARDAMPNGGILTIETRNVSLTSTLVNAYTEVAPGDYVTLTVTDTGIGMSEEVKKHLFEPFFTTKDVGRGSGLGLATCYGIVTQNQGYIWVSSQPNMGTSMQIYLRRTFEIPMEYNAYPDGFEEMNQGQETILLVEDEEAVRHLAKRVLQRQGYTVIEASNGQEALEVLEDYQHLQVDLLVTDMVMPQMSGTALAGYLTAINLDLKVLFISGYTNIVLSDEEMIQYNNADFLQKPFSPDTLARKVREILD